MSKKKTATQKKAKSKNPLLNLFLMLVIGPAIIVSSVATGYYVGGLVGLALVVWGVWETPEIHPTLKLVFNWKSRNKTQTQHVEVKQSPDAQVNTAGRDVNVFNLPAKKELIPDPTGMTLAQLGDRVYNPIVQEVSKWGDPLGATCSQWDELQLAERRLSLKVPEKISSLLNQANELFPKRQQARFNLHEYIDEATKSDLINSKLVRPEDLGTVEFRVVGYPGVTERVYPSWIWEYETDLSNYLWDFVESRYPQNTKWELETWVYPPKGGVGVRVGGEPETRNTINHVLRFLMIKPFARELQGYNKQIRELGKTITSLIDEELKKG